MNKPNLNFRPKSYFGPKSLTEHSISEIKNEAVKSRLFQLFYKEKYDEVEELLSTYDEKNELGDRSSYFNGWKLS